MITIFTLVIFNFMLLMFIFMADFIRNKIKFKATYEELKNSYPLFLRYLDKYYITNLTYTIVACIMYIIGTIILLLIIRYMFIGQIIFLLRLDNSMASINYSFFLTLILKYLLFLLGIYLYKILLQILFYKEIIKLRIYLQQFFKYRYIYSFCTFNFGEYICKLIWILSYRIATQTFRDDLFEGDFDIWKDNLVDYNEFNYDNVYKNIYINRMIRYLMYISSKSLFITYLFYYNAKLFKFISKHISDGLFKFIPYMLIILCLLYEIHNRELYFIYYATFCYFIYYVMLNFRKFEQKIDLSYISRLENYFYQNDFSYLIQRSYIKKATNYSIDNTSRQNDSILNAFNLGKNDFNSGIIFSVLNNMTIDSNTNTMKKITRQLTFSYLRATIIAAFIIVNISLYNILDITINSFKIEISNYFIFCPIIMMIFLTNKIFYRTIDSEFTKDEGYTENVYNRKYSIVFWILVLLQIYIYWLVILKPELFFMTTNVLIELPYDIFNISKIYSQDEKIMYLYQYFEFYLNMIPENDKIKLDIDLLRFIIRQIDFGPLVDNLTLKDIQVYIKLLIERYINDINFIPELQNQLLRIIEETDKIEQKRLQITSYIMDPIVNYGNAIILKFFMEFYRTKIGHAIAKKGIVIIKKTFTDKSAYTAIKFIWSCIKELFKNKK